MLGFSILYSFFKIFGDVCVGHDCMHWVRYIGSQNSFLAYSSVVFSVFVGLL